MLVKYLLGETTPQESHTVEAWLAADKKNRQDFDTFCTIWEKSRLLAAKSDTDEEAAWKRFQQRFQPKALNFQE